MQIKLRSIFIIYINVLSSLLIIFAACSVPTSTLDHIDPPTDSQGAAVVGDDDQIDTSTPVPAISTTLSLQTTPTQDGHLWLERYCAACHVVQWIEQFDESRTYWENILEQMAGLGVKIDESKRDLILDYLTSDNEL